MSYGNEPTIEPDHSGPGGRAWRIPEQEFERPEQAATCAAWLVCAPPSNMHWWWYLVAGIHLRPIPDTPPPHVQFPGATHEILFAALSPEVPLPPLDRWRGSVHLEPLDLVHQVILPDDEHAAEMVELAVRHMTAGYLMPDEDNRKAWRDALNMTAEHMRLGYHPH